MINGISVYNYVINYRAVNLINRVVHSALSYMSLCLGLAGTPVVTHSPVFPTSSFYDCEHLDYFFQLLR